MLESNRVCTTCIDMEETLRIELYSELVNSDVRDR